MVELIFRGIDKTSVIKGEILKQLGVAMFVTLYLSTSD